MKFSAVGRQHLAEACSKIRENEPCAKYSVKFLRPRVRALLLKVAAGERIPPEFVRIALSGCLKVAVLKALVNIIPSKAKGIRVQFFGAPSFFLFGLEGDFLSEPSFRPPFFFLSFFFSIFFSKTTI